MELKLRCPDCGEPLRYNEPSIQCSCGRQFFAKKAYIELLPKKLEDNKRNENKKHMKDTDSIISPPWLLFSLRGHTQLKYFKDEFVKGKKLEGDVLELGGAFGWQAGFIKHFFPETNVVTTDVSPHAVLGGYHFSQLMKFKTDWHIACDGEKLPFENNSFDFLFSSAYVHHLYNIKKGVLEAHRVLKKGGKWFVIGELDIRQPFKAIWTSKYCLKGRVQHKEGIREGAYNLSKWEKYFKDAGFKIEKYEYICDWNYKLYNWMILVYYKFLGFLPKWTYGRIFPCEIHFELVKK